jgi:uncharacterized protein YutD
MIWIEGAKRINISFTLMFAEHQVETFELHIAPSGVSVHPIDILCDKLVPVPIQKHTMNLRDWLLSRCMHMKSHRNIFMIESIFDMESRDSAMPFVLSLLSNSVSLADKYWLNPNDDVKFKCNGIDILIRRKNWDDVDPFRNTIISQDINNIAFNDSFIGVNCNSCNKISLNWTTNGNEIKRWNCHNGLYVLEKRMCKHRLEIETKTFDFFSKRDVCAPSYIQKHIDVQDSNQYDFDTIENGIDFIQKQCITDESSWILSLSDYIGYMSNDIELYDLIRSMFFDNGVSVSDIDKFINTIKSYIVEFCIDCKTIDTSNFGLLINLHGKVKSAVWGGLSL